MLLILTAASAKIPARVRFPPENQAESGCISLVVATVAPWRYFTSAGSQPATIYYMRFARIDMAYTHSLPNTHDTDSDWDSGLGMGIPSSAPTFGAPQFP